MATFEITGPDGKRYEVKGETAEGALAALKKKLNPRGEGGGRGTGIEAALIGARQGVTFGFGDEINAGVRAAGDFIGNPLKMGDGKPFDEAYDDRLRHERAVLDQARSENPVASAVGEVGGALLVPAGAVSTARGAMGLGAATGGVYGFGEGEGGLESRAAEAAQGAFSGALFSGALAGAQKGLRASYTRLVNRNVKRPTVEGLRAQKTAAYKAVDDAGETFGADETANLFQTVSDAFDNTNFVPEVDRQGFAALKILEKQAGKKVTLGQLDKVRQGLWKRFAAADNETHILDAISAVDDMIESRAGTSDLMKAARAANSKYAKSQLLEDAFKKAELQTAGTGSGGNILNKYRQAVTAIVTNPKKAKWFSQDEIALMEHFVEGDLSENVLRRVGKLAPGGNGLMQALSLVAASVDPTFIAASGAAQGAKTIADRGAMAGASAIQDAVATGIVPRPQAQNFAPAARVGGLTGSGLTRE